MSNITNGNFIRKELEKETVVNLNFEYLAKHIEDWWAHRDVTHSNHMLKLQLTSIILQNIKDSDSKYFEKLGSNYIAAVCITKIFSIDDYILAFLVHEALCELFHLHDVAYSYETHKTLFLKPTGENYRDWGNGYGEITPHSDDLYEETETDLLALTVCRDKTKTPTTCYFPKDIFANFSDTEIKQLMNVRAKFISGKNVNIFKAKERNLIEYDDINGVRVYLDFRIDNNTGERMIVNNKDKDLIEKLRTSIMNCPPVCSVPETGTFLIVANHKVLHARATLNIEQNMAAKIAANSDITTALRVLYRSKGSRIKLQLT